MGRFRQASRSESYLKLGIEGISGAGKTYSSIKLMQGLVGAGNFVLFDTENGSGELYSQLCAYDYHRMKRPFKPADCVDLIGAAVEDGYQGIIIDSFSHFWKYILEYKEALDQRPNSNSFRNWGKVKPMYEELKGTILHSPIHIVCCLRSKAEYIQTEGANGKARIEKVGVNPITEPENEYEFTTVFSVDRTNQAQSTKDRTSMFSGGLPFTISDKTGKQFLDWLHSANGGVYTESVEWAEVSKGNEAARDAAKEAASLGIGTEVQKELPAKAKRLSFGYEPEGWPTEATFKRDVSTAQLDKMSDLASSRNIPMELKGALRHVVLAGFGLSEGNISMAHQALFNFFLKDATDDQLHLAIEAAMAIADKAEEPAG
jgi:hypothetical protein